MGKTVEVFVYAEEESQFFKSLPASNIGLNGGDDDKPTMSGYSGIKCKFGRFGQTIGIYQNSTLIKCSSPSISEDPDDIYQETVTFSIALNGVDFNEETGLIDFTFIGTGSWLGLTGVVIAILMLGALFAAVVYYIHWWQMGAGPGSNSGPETFTSAYDGQ